MMKVAATIPMNPKHGKELGFYSIFAYTSRLARSEGVVPIYALNVVGKTDATTAITLLRLTIGSLEIEPHRWWIDSELQQEHLATLLNSHLKRNLVCEEVHELKRCNCGNVEYFARIPLISGRKSLIRDNRSICCNSDLYESTANVLVTAPLPVVPLPKVHPEWAQRELGAVLAKLTGTRLLLSRTAPRPVSWTQATGERFLDTDVLWWFYQYWLTLNQCDLRHLVIGASTIRQAGVLLSLSTLMGLQLPDEVHVLPRVAFEPVHGLSDTQELLDRFGVARITNALTWSALSGRKEITLRGMLFPQMSEQIPIDHVLSSRTGLFRIAKAM